MSLIGCQVGENANMPFRDQPLFIAPLLAVAGLLNHSVAAQSADTLNALLAAERCLLAAELHAVYEHPSPFKERDLFSS